MNPPALIGDEEYTALYKGEEYSAEPERSPEWLAPFVEKGLTREEVLALFRHPVVLYYLAYKQMPYGWQKKILRSDRSRISVRTSRQAGKTTTVAVKIAHRLLCSPKRENIFIIAPTKEQSSIIYRKVQEILEEFDAVWSILAPHKNLKQSLELVNGNTLRITAKIRGHSPTLIVVDEAAFVAEAVYTAASPSLIATQGDQILISTPFGKQGMFYKTHSVFNNWETYHVKWSEVPHLRKDLVEQEKQGMTDLEFAQEFEAEFIDTADNYFTTEEIQAMLASNAPRLGRTPSEETLNREKYVYYLGVDLARMGLDESVYSVCRAPKSMEGTISIVHLEETQKKPTTDAVGRIIAMHEHYKFETIYIDEGSVGGGVIDELTLTHRLPVVAVNFASKADASVDDSKKEAMYKNFKLLAEKNLEFYKAWLTIAETNNEDASDFEGLLALPVHTKLANQLQALKYQYSTNGVLRVHHPPGGHDDHCFVAGTPILSERGQVPIETLVVGDRVMTRGGWQQVIGTDNRVVPVITHLGLTGTPDHPVFTKNRGVVPLKNINASDVLYIWNEKQWSIEERTIIATPTAKAEASEHTTTPTRNGKNHPSHSTDKCGWTLTEQFRKVWSSITRTATATTTASRTSSLSNEERTNATTHSNEQTKQEPTSPNTRDPKQASGIVAKKEGNGIENTPSVQGSARVYNLAVENYNEYFANNILVHNCDAVALSLYWCAGRRHNPLSLGGEMVREAAKQRAEVKHGVRTYGDMLRQYGKR